MARSSFRTVVIKVSGNRTVLRIFYYPWRAFPYPLRRAVTALFIKVVLLQKRLFRVDSQNELTLTKQLLNLSFWGIPEIELKDYRLHIEGAVAQPMSFSFDEIRALPSVTRQVRMDCVGGPRNNSIMKGVLLKEFLDRLGIEPEAQRVVFHCADRYYTSIDLKELLDRGAFLAYTVNDGAIPKFGYPLRLAITGKYGYQWAKWVVGIELVADARKGYWAQLGLPDRADLGDVW